jgi:hypothetical protein
VTVLGWTRPLRSPLLLVLVLIAALAPSLRAQADASAPPPATIAVFLDCVTGCDGDFIRTEIGYVDWVRDRAAADVHVLMTSEGTGGGGRRFTIGFLGLRGMDGVGDTLHYVAPESSTQDLTRQGVVRTIKLGLVRFLTRTALADRLTVSVGPATTGTAAAPAVPTRDPWRFWVFALSGNASLDGEQQSGSMNFNGQLSARRTTNEWKINLRGDQRYGENRFDLGDGEEVVSLRRSTDVVAYAVRSLGPRVSAGARLQAGSSSFNNRKYFYKLSPAIEFDVYPYSESTRRSFVLIYAPGVETAQYREITIYGEMAETRPLHQLSAELHQNQPWGSAYGEVNAGEYLHDRSKRFASVSAGANVRLFSGLSLNFNGNFSSIHNQLSIPRRDATEQEILLQQRQLATDYSFYGSVGFRYTFGSVFNSIVNPRFGTFF